MTELTRFQCHACGKKLKAPQKLAGKKLPCTRCNSELTVPGETRLLKPNTDKSAKNTRLPQKVGHDPYIQNPVIDSHKTGRRRLILATSLLVVVQAMDLIGISLLQPEKMARLAARADYDAMKKSPMAHVADQNALKLFEINYRGRFELASVFVKVKVYVCIALFSVLAYLTWKGSKSARRILSITCFCMAALSIIFAIQGGPYVLGVIINSIVALVYIVLACLLLGKKSAVAPVKSPVEVVTL